MKYLIILLTLLCIGCAEDRTDTDTHSLVKGTWTKTSQDCSDTAPASLTITKNRVTYGLGANDYKDSRIVGTSIEIGDNSYWTFGFPNYTSNDYDVMTFNFSANCSGTYSRN